MVCLGCNPITHSFILLTISHKLVKMCSQMH